jgi:hypothetical protein
LKVFFLPSDLTGYDNQCFTVTETEDIHTVEVVQVDAGSGKRITIYPMDGSERRKTSDPTFEIENSRERGKLSTLSLPEIVIEVKILNFFKLNIKF